MVRITITSKSDIENMSAIEIQTLLRKAGVQVSRVRVTRLSEKQYRQAIS